MYVCMYVCMYVYIPTHTHIYIYIYIYTYTYIYNIIYKTGMVCDKGRKRAQEKACSSLAFYATKEFRCC